MFEEGRSSVHLAAEETLQDDAEVSRRAWMATGSTIVLLATVVALVLLPDRDEGPRALMCPEPRSTQVFVDSRRFCASEATALARIDWDGRLTYLVDPDSIPCRIPEFEVINENTTRIGGPLKHCDSDTAGSSLYLFPRCSLTLNYPGNEDYRVARPIGLLVERSDCT